MHDFLQGRGPANPQTDFQVCFVFFFFFFPVCFSAVSCWLFGCVLLFLFLAGRLFWGSDVVPGKNMGKGSRLEAQVKLVPGQVKVLQWPQTKANKLDSNDETVSSLVEVHHSRTWP